MYKKGDIILIEHKTSPIIKFMRLFQKDEVKYGHIVIVTDDVNNMITESLWRVITRPIEECLNLADSYKIIRRNNISDNELDRIVKLITSLLNRRYGISRILLQLCDHLLNVNFFTKLNKNKYNQVCSSLVAWAYYCVCKIKFNDVEWMSCDPDDIDDDLIKNPDQWTIIEESI